MPQSIKQLRQYSQVAKSLWDNPEFIKAGFHIIRFVTAAVNTKADRENIKVLLFRPGVHLGSNQCKHLKTSLL
jgi:hypothetical protein